jgi:hypothetical protein
VARERVSDFNANSGRVNFQGIIPYPFDSQAEAFSGMIRNVFEQHNF